LQGNKKGETQMFGGRTRLAYGLMMSLSGVAATLPAFASSEVADPAETTTTTDTNAIEKNGLQEITVTAQRRRENLQDVPIAVTTVTEASLVNSGISTTKLLPLVTPGFVMDTVLRNAAPFIRGVGSTNFGLGDPAVATYVDGVYYFAPTSSVFSLNSIDHVEVLKGPQGTLFGRNATGGLVNVITRDPQTEPSVRGTLSYGNYQTEEGSLYATGGTGNIAADIAGHLIRQGEGYGTNLLTGAEINRQHSSDLRSKILWRPTDGDRLTLSVDWSRDLSDFGLNTNAYPGEKFVGGYGLRGTAYDSQSNFAPSYEQTQWGASLHFQHDLGWGSLSFLTAYRHLNENTSDDADDSPLPIYTTHFAEEDSSLQNEVVLVGKVGRLDYTVGEFLFHATSGYRPFAQRSPSIPVFNQDNYTLLQTDSYAGFAQGTYAVTDATNVTAGLRYTIDQRTFDARVVAASGNANPPGTVLSLEDERATFPKLTWRFAIDRKLAANVLGYLSYNRGFKSGNYAEESPTQPVVKPETLDALEGGVKSEFFDHVLRFNLSVFHYWYKDIQLSQYVGTYELLLNAAAARMYGGEIDSAFAPEVAFGHFELTGGLSYLHGRYTSFPNGPTNTPLPAGGSVVGSADLSGRTTIRSPKLTTSLGADYRIPVGSDELGINVSYYFNDGYFWEPDNSLRQPSYSLINGQVSYAFGSDKRYKLRLFADNITDKVHYTWAVSSPFGRKEAADTPRTYGVAFDFAF
jgi:iron complex outermembrane recepter protein